MVERPSLQIAGEGQSFRPICRGDLMQITYNFPASASFVALDPALESSTNTRRHLGKTILWVVAGGCTTALLDTLVAMAWWGPRGIAPEHILQGFFSWFIGAAAFSHGMNAAVLGALTYALLMCGLVTFYYACARRFALLWERPLLCGGVYGALAYFAIFQVMVPMLTGAHPKAHDMSWIATCVVTYMTFVGMPCALFSRAAHRAIG